MAIDQERAKQLALEIRRTCQSQTENAVWFDVLKCAKLLFAYAAEERRAERKRCAEIARKWPYSDIYAKEHIAAAIEQGRG